MRAVLLEVPEAMLAERRRLGLDGRDEMWNSVLYMVPPPGGLEQQSERGAEGAELIVEIRSEGDVTYKKIDFYVGIGVREILIVHPEGRTVELLRTVGDQLLLVGANAEGGVRSDVLGVQFTTVEGRLRITWEDGVADV